MLNHLKHRLTALVVSLFIFSGAGTAFGESITLATLNWEPFYGEKLPENGFVAALSREAFRRAGYELNIKFMNWNRALELSKKGKFDGILGAYYSEERAAHFVFPAPVSQNQESFIAKKGAGITFAAVEDLKSYKIGGLLGSAPIAELKKAGLRIEATADELSSLKKLNAGRIDLAVMGRQNLNYAMANQDGFKELNGAFDILEPPFKAYDLFCPITRKRDDARAIADKFNTALEEMKADGTYDEILTRFGQK